MALLDADESDDLRIALEAHGLLAGVIHRLLGAVPCPRLAIRRARCLARAVTSIWASKGDAWTLLAPVGFPDERKLELARLLRVSVDDLMGWPKDSPP